MSDILMLLKPQRLAAGAIDFGPDCTVHLPPDRGVRCYAVGQGECWIEVEGFGEEVRLDRDDCVLLSSGRPFRIRSVSNGELPAFVDPAVFSRDGISKVNNGGACVIIGGHFLLDTAHEQFLSTALPPLFVVRSQGQRDALGSALKSLWMELETPQPGGRLVIEHLNQMMLIFALRLCVTSDAQHPTGWLSALADRRVAKAMCAIHASPKRQWTLQELASVAGMSRTVFAERFKTLVGSSPMAYLSRWRMAIAAYHLGELHLPVGQVALTVGYSSETSFSTAFRKAIGISPSMFAQTSKQERSRVVSEAIGGPQAQSRPLPE